MANQSHSDLTTIVLVLLGVLVLWPVLMMGFGGFGMGFGGMGYGGMMSGPYGSGGGAFGLVGLGIQLVFLLVLLGGGYFLVRRVLDERESHDTALEELRHAYARGDLSEEEFETRRSKLQSNE
ncbi:MULTISPECIES: SHOCT domain-containing protein [unclassified Haloferax]|jgi:putative membrane protein|uniref:SHOCT domain-containing protein n=1 Tax=unclassified Haloferax TaxID=2625095 RepID=UPI002874B874|nr:MULTISPECIES: SHOCT domain-containing protein [unclassified Haloferax]MDS0243196.1 SHOCT domain-containing protein [Haloferax sp. S2CR25]MDS0446317.1 SHOCT domain-containing protein [Haloferax sp. S2CR25-2]